MLHGRRVLVAVCGSIAAYKAGEVVRGLGKAGAEVDVILTDGGARFVAPATFAALSGRPVHTSLFAEPERVIHVELARSADLLLVCGATASTLARLAAGTGEDLLSATYLMCRCPVLVAPAMHTEMWEHDAVGANVRVLEDRGAEVVPPQTGDLASGDHGPGRLADPADIVEAVARALTDKDLAGVRVLVTAGPTREALDPVRFISNRSSGKMGVALALEAHRRGASVTVVAGPLSAPLPPVAAGRGFEVVHVETTDEMLAECVARLEETDVVVKAAAVADWRPARIASQKVKKSDGLETLELEPTPDIAGELGRKKGSQLIVLFAAETEHAVEYAQDKLARKNADLIVANVVGRPGTGFDSDTNEAALITPGEVQRCPQMPKRELAGRIWDRVADLLPSGQRR